MNKDEMHQYLTGIITKAVSPALAASAIIDGGFCGVTNVDEELGILWKKVGPRDFTHRRSLNIKWTPQSVYVRVWRFDATGKNMPEALMAIRDKVKGWYDTFDGEYVTPKGWDR